MHFVSGAVSSLTFNFFNEVSGGRECCLFVARLTTQGVMCGTWTVFVTDTHSCTEQENVNLLQHF